jgi:16S rRNA G966 N2-methylase RsmD
MIESHPAADAFPMMDRKEAADLKNSIRKRGQQVPIILCQGKILDGRNRYKACVELGIKPVTKEFDGDGSPWLWVWDHNAERRHLPAGTKAAIRLDIEEGDEAWASKMAEAKAEADRKRSAATTEQHKVSNPRAGESSGSGSKVTTTIKDHKTRKARAEVAGTSSGTMAKAETVKKNAPDLHSKVTKGKLSLSSAYKQLQGRTRATKQAAAIKSVSSEVPILETSDFREFLKNNKCDVVITDPPYPKEYVHLYGELAKACAENGITRLAAMAGQSYLPEILHEMAKHMPYRWTIAYLTPGGQATQLWDRKVNTFWKPIIVMGEVGDDWLGDVAKSKTNDNDKAFHEWGQSESGMIDLIERLSAPGEIVCDPFLGAGTTGVAAIASGRRFIGCDIDEERVNVAKTRLIQ